MTASAALAVVLATAVAVASPSGARADAPAPTPTATAQPDPIATLALDQSFHIVFPVRDWYRDTLSTVVDARDANGSPVAVTGAATLTRGSTTVRRWTIDSAEARVVWDGRVDGRIEPAAYVLAVAAQSADGTVRTASTTVAVSSQRLHRTRLVTRYDPRPKRAFDLMPSEILDAYSLGPVTARVRTTATVHGPAFLNFSNGVGSGDVPLRTGTHLSRVLHVPVGYGWDLITHHWTRGVVRLRSLAIVWTFLRLR